MECAERSAVSFILLFLASLWIAGGGYDYLQVLPSPPRFSDNQLHRCTNVHKELHAGRTTAPSKPHPFNLTQKNGAILKLPGA